MVSTGHVGGTPGSGIVSSAADVLGISVVRGIRVVGRVCETCMTLYGSGGVGGEGGAINPVGTGGVLDICLCLGFGGVGGVGGEWVGVMDQGL